MVSSESNASDDISLFLRQLLHRSTSSPPPPPPPLSSPLPFLPVSSPLPPGLLPSSKQPHSFSFALVPTAPPPAVVFTGDGGGGGLLDAFHQLPSGSAAFTFSDRVFPMDELSGLASSGLSFSPKYLQAGAVGSNNYSVSSVGTVEAESVTAGSVEMRSLENDVDDYDCDSEEGTEAVVEEAQGKNNPSRSSSKRSRAAEVHNLSEKRRRSRINEKMKALQNLIPNSNKTDKASMLDEAIEYLKQLQLQVQMLSMRNGLSLHPMCLPGMSGLLHPGQLSQLGSNFNGWDKPLFSEPASTISLGTSEQCPAAATTTAATVSPLTFQNISSLRDEAFSGLDSSSSSSAHHQPASFTLPTSSQGIHGEYNGSLRQSIINHPRSTSLGFKIGSTSNGPLSLSKFGQQPPDARECSGETVQLLTSCPQ